MPKKMLILRGNHGSFPDETGKTHDYKWGALHEKAAKDYAMLRGYDGVVLDISGDPAEKKKGEAKGPNRSHSAQTILALKRFKEDPDIVALYGFSGGGYNVWWILQALKDDKAALARLKLIAVLGAPEQPEAEYHKSKYGSAATWELKYKVDPVGARYVVNGKRVVLKGDEAHMFGPEKLLEETLEKI